MVYVLPISITYYNESIVPCKVDTQRLLTFIIEHAHLKSSMVHRRIESAVNAEIHSTYIRNYQSNVFYEEKSSCFVQMHANVDALVFICQSQSTTRFH